ncbi:MAG TPA: hypothetical protein VED01_22305 [Burkholderiales bacterium]|nr:hypothetical protein [Burkholderiales bacterium]
MKLMLGAIACALVTVPAIAQHHHHAASPYSGFETREIKALSDAQIRDLRAGRGMSMALAAELNGYPGPLHVLELAEALALTADQRARTDALLGEMKKAAAELGRRLIESERRLDALFTAGSPTAEDIATATAEIGALQGRLRALHLSYHLHMKQLLTPQQVARYNGLRGYVAARQ